MVMRCALCVVVVVVVVVEAVDCGSGREGRGCDIRLRSWKEYVEISSNEPLRLIM